MQCNILQLWCISIIGCVQNGVLTYCNITAHCIESSETQAGMLLCIQCYAILSSHNNYFACLMFNLTSSISVIIKLIQFCVNMSCFFLLKFGSLIKQQVKARACSFSSFKMESQVTLHCGIHYFSILTNCVQYTLHSNIMLVCYCLFWTEPCDRTELVCHWADLILLCLCVQGVLFLAGFLTDFV